MWKQGKCYVVLTVLLINDKYRIYDISMADMLKSLLSKSSQDDTFPFTRETMTNFEIARISSMHNINFTYTLLISACLSPKRRYSSI